MCLLGWDHGPRSRPARRTRAPGGVPRRENVQYGFEFGVEADGTLSEIHRGRQVPVRSADTEPAADEPPVLLGGAGEVPARIRSEDGVPQTLPPDWAGGTELSGRMGECLETPSLDGQFGGADGRVLQERMAEYVRPTVAGQWSGSRA